MWSRYYDPAVGRYLNHDTVFDYDVGLQGYNLFSYCGNAPVFRIDVSGQDSDKIDDDLVEDEIEQLGGGSEAGGHNHSGTGGVSLGTGISISTGRTVPRNLQEQLAMESAMSNPSAGKMIISQLNDPRLPSTYSKYQQVFHTSVGNISIHYVGDMSSGEFTDFKFVN